VFVDGRLDAGRAVVVDKVEVGTEGVGSCGRVSPNSWTAKVGEGNLVRSLGSKNEECLVTIERRLAPVGMRLRDFATVFAGTAAVEGVAVGLLAV